MSTRIPISRGRSESGSAVLELALIFPFLTLLLFGSVGIGIMLGRYIQCEQICRDVAHMFSDGVDFSQAANQNIIIQQLALGTGITATGGNGVIILSKISTVYQADCNAAGYGTQCVNLGLPVFVNRITIGNSSLLSSYFGTPSSTLMDTEGNISPSVYMTNADPSVQTTNFAAQLSNAITRAGATTPGTAPSCGNTGASPVCAQTDSEISYVCEVYLQYPDISFLGFTTAGGAYMRFVFSS